MSRVMRIALVFTLVVAIVSGGLLSAGCGKESKAALVKPTIDLFQFSKGVTVDFDEDTINQAAANTEANVRYGTAKKIYHSVWAANQEAVANYLFPAPYWKGDGTTTQYSMLSSGDQTAVDGAVFASKLNAAEQDKVTEAVGGLFGLYDAETAAAMPLEQNTAYGILYVTDNTGAMSAAWKADAEAWVTALDGYAGANFDGKAFAALTWAQRQAAMAAVFNKGAGTINPEYAFWRAMTQNSFRNGVASTMNPTVRDNVTATYFPGKAYAELDCVQGPTVDARVWYRLLADNLTAPVEMTVGGMLASQPTLEGVFAGKGMASAQAGFAAEVAGGMNVELAFYKWLGYESIRNSFVMGYYPTVLGARLAELYPDREYASLTKCEQMALAAAVWAALDPYEQGFGDAVVAGLWAKVQAEMTDAVAMDQTTLVRGPDWSDATAGTETSVINWKKDVESGLAVPAAYYRWLAKESLIALKGMGTLIRLSQAEFIFKVTNPNKYAISLESAEFFFYVNSTAVSQAGTRVAAAKVAMNDRIWVPAEDELLVKVAAPVKVMDMVTWLVMAGETTANAQRLAADVWAQYQAGTQTWSVTIESYVSDDKGANQVTATYTI